MPSPHDQIRESTVILLTMGLNSDEFLHQPFTTQNEFQNDQISLSNSPPRRHTYFRLRAAVPQIVAKHRRWRRRHSSQAGNKI
jgi:hypothetical protein